MTHDLRDALIDALRKVCPNPDVAADVCLAVVERWTADEPQAPLSNDALSRIVHNM